MKTIDNIIGTSMIAVALISILVIVIGGLLIKLEKIKTTNYEINCCTNSTCIAIKGKKNDPNSRTNME